MVKKRTIHEAAFRLAYDMSLQMAPRLESLGVSLAPQQLRTMRLIWSKSECTLVDVSRTLKRDKGQVARIIDGLEKAGMVSREPNPNDGRSKLLKLTHQGHNFFDSIEAIEADFSKDLRQGLSAEDLKTFFRVSDQISENIRSIDS